MRTRSRWRILTERGFRIAEICRNTALVRKNGWSAPAFIIGSEGESWSAHALVIGFGEGSCSVHALSIAYGEASWSVHALGIACEDNCCWFYTRFRNALYREAGNPHTFSRSFLMRKVSCTCFRSALRGGRWCACTCAFKKNPQQKRRKICTCVRNVFCEA